MLLFRSLLKTRRRWPDARSKLKRRRWRHSCEILEDRTLLSGTSFGTAEFLDVSPFNQVAVIIDEVDAVDDVDMFEVVLLEGDRLFAEIDTGAFGNELDSLLRVFNSFGEEVAFNDDFFGTDSFIDFTVDETDAYFIGVSSFGNDSYDPISGIPTGDGFTFGVFELTVDVVLTNIFTDDSINEDAFTEDELDDLATLLFLDDVFDELDSVLDEIGVDDSIDDTDGGTGEAFQDNVADGATEAINAFEFDDGDFDDPELSSDTANGDTAINVDGERGLVTSAELGLVEVDADQSTGTDEDGDTEERRSKRVRFRDANFLAYAQDLDSGGPFDLIINRDGFNALLTAARFRSHLWFGSSFYEDLLRPAAYALADLLGDGDLDLWVTDEGDEIATLFDLQPVDEDDDSATDPSHNQENSLSSNFLQDYLANYFLERAFEPIALVDELLVTPSIRIVRASLPRTDFVDQTGHAIELYLYYMASPVRMNAQTIGSALSKLSGSVHIPNDEAAHRDTETIETAGTVQVKRVLKHTAESRRNADNRIEQEQD